MFTHDAVWFSIDTVRHHSAARHREAGLAEVDSLALAAAAHVLERLLLAAQLAEAGLLAAQHGVLRVAQVPAQLQLVALCNNTAANGVNTQSSESCFVRKRSGANSPAHSPFSRWARFPYCGSSSIERRLPIAAVYSAWKRSSAAAISSSVVWRQQGSRPR